MEKNGLLVESKQMPCSILSSLNDMRKNGIWCDLRLEIPDKGIDGGAVVFPVHRCVVGAASKSLAVLVDRKLEHAVLNNLDSHYVSLCINYMYGKGIFVPFSDVPDLMKCATQLQLSGLVDICKTSLEQTPTDNVHKIESSDSELKDEEASDNDEFPSLDQSHDVKAPLDLIEVTSQSGDNDDHSVDGENNESMSVDEEVLLEEVKEEPEITKPKLFSCSQCPLKFKRLSLLEHHERKHREGAAVPSLLQCSMCEFSATTRREASLHKAWHIKDNELRCDHCQLAFKIAMDFEKHVSFKHQSHSVVKDEATEDRVSNEAGQTIPKKLRTKLTAASDVEDSEAVDTEDQNQKTRSSSPNYTGITLQSGSDAKLEELPEEVCISDVMDDDLSRSEFNPEPEKGEYINKIPFRQTRKGGRVKGVGRNRFAAKSKALRTYYGEDDRISVPDEPVSPTTGTGQKTRSRLARKRRFSTSFGYALKKTKKNEPDPTDYDFDLLADELGVPDEIRPQLQPSEWPEHLQQGRFKRNRRAAYRLYYINQFKEYTCEVCGELIRGKQRYDVHRRKEKGQYVYCSFCAKAFISQGSLKTHEMRHKNQKDVRCELCDFSCYYKHKLKQHMQNVHGELGGPVVHLCSQCPKTFKSAQSLTVHEMRIHNKDKWKKEQPIHRCEQCDYVGFSKRDVELHMAKHSKVKPYVCYICRRYAFKRVKELNKHIRVKHNEEPKPSKHKTLATSSDSVKEEEPEPIELLPPLPKPIKTYQCRHCEYNTTNPQNLKAHVVIHSDDRPFPCPVCTLSFKRKNVMVRHAWRLHKIDLRSVCYEYTETGKKKRKDIEPKLVFVETPQVQGLVAEGGVDSEVLGEVSDVQDVPQALYTTMSDDGQAVVLKAEDETYIHNLQFLGAESSKNVDINVISEVVVDSGSVYGDTSVLPDPEPSTHTIAVPITGASGLTAETQIVIDSNVLKSMGLEHINPSQLKIITDTDS